jgi:hypothetical protein
MPPRCGAPLGTVVAEHEIAEADVGLVSTSLPEVSGARYGRRVAIGMLCLRLRGMKMSEVAVGMRLRSTLSSVGGDITVTEITERGFKYRYDAPAVMHPRLGIALAADGHEHFGLNGEALYEAVQQP